MKITDIQAYHVRIEDPSGRSAERVLNTDQTVADWVERVKGQLAHFLDFDGDNPAVLVSNLDWTAPISLLDFLRRAEPVDPDL